jgi:hypothetical protein
MYENGFTVSVFVFLPHGPAGQDPALVDLDLLGAAWPAPDDDPYQTRLKATNAAAVWANFQAVGSRRLVIAGIVESAAERDLLAQAVGSPVVICHLAASPGVLEQRILGRGRDHGAGLDRLIRRAAELAGQLADVDVAEFVVETDDRSADEIATEVVRRWNSTKCISPVGP